MNTDALRSAIAEDAAAGRTPIAVVASAGTVNTGAVDPLEEIAGIAYEHGRYLHVDAAYGGLAALAAPERIGPLGLADSVSFDLHKWLYQPVDCGLLLFRDRELARRAFTYTDDYVVSFADDPFESFMYFEESLELSRRFRALKVWLSVRYHGAQRISRFESVKISSWRSSSGRKVEEADELELLTPVELSAVCFRAIGAVSSDLDALKPLDTRGSQRPRSYLPLQRHTQRHVCAPRLHHESPDDRGGSRYRDRRGHERRCLSDRGLKSYADRPPLASLQATFLDSMSLVAAMWACGSRVTPVQLPYPRRGDELSGGHRIRCLEGRRSSSTKCRRGRSLRGGDSAKTLATVVSLESATPPDQAPTRSAGRRGGPVLRARVRARENGGRSGRGPATRPQRASVARGRVPDP